MKIHRYSAEQKDFLRANVVGADFEDLTMRFNQAFGVSLRRSQIMSACYRMGLGNGKDAGFKPGSEAGKPYRFPPGHVPFNKGLKGIGGWGPTQFKKGHRPSNCCPVGTEKQDRDGYTKVKIAEPNKWKYKHILVWESANGPVPHGYAILFADQDKENCALGNLSLIARSELLYLNRHGLVGTDAESTQTGIKIAKLAAKANTLKYPKQKTGSHMGTNKKISVIELARRAGINPATASTMVSLWRKGKSLNSPTASVLKKTILEAGLDLNLYIPTATSQPKAGKEVPSLENMELAVSAESLSSRQELESTKSSLAHIPLEMLIGEITRRLPSVAITITI